MPPPSLRFKGGDRLPPLVSALLTYYDRSLSNSLCTNHPNCHFQPPKTFCCRDLNPEYLSRRKDQLQKFMHDLLVIPGVSDDPAVREFLHLQASKAMYV